MFRFCEPPTTNELESQMITQELAKKKKKIHAPFFNVNVQWKRSICRREDILGPNHGMYQALYLEDKYFPENHRLRHIS